MTWAKFYIILLLRHRQYGVQERKLQQVKMCDVKSHLEASSPLPWRSVRRLASSKPAPEDTADPSFELRQFVPPLLNSSHLSQTSDLSRLRSVRCHEAQSGRWVCDAPSHAFKVIPEYSTNQIGQADNRASFHRLFDGALTSDVTDYIVFLPFTLTSDNYSFLTELGMVQRNS